MSEKGSRYMVWLNNELKEQVESFVRTSLGIKVTNLTDIVNIAEIVRKAVHFAINEKRNEFRDYLSRG